MTNETPLMAFMIVLEFPKLKGVVIFNIHNDTNIHFMRDIRVVLYLCHYLLILRKTKRINCRNYSFFFHS